MERLFIATPLSPDQIHQLMTWQSAIRNQADTCSLTKVENLHLTLRFLGDCDQRKTRQVIEILNELGKAQTPFDATLIGIDHFSRSDGFLVYAKMSVPGAEQLVEKLERRLQSAGFVPEKKKWLPHVTLARRVHFKPDRKPWSTHPGQGEEIRSVRLYRSEFTPNGMKYTVLHEVNLQPIRR